MSETELLHPMQGNRARPGEPGGAAIGAGGLTRIGGYDRRMPAAMDRMMENALDWEHLPWLHDSSFTWIKRLEAGDWGWRCRIGQPSTGKPQEITLELLLDTPSRTWVSRVLKGMGAGSEIWTTAEAHNENELTVHVQFWMAGLEGVAEEVLKSFGEGYARLYERLYDEDEGMMVERQSRLDHLKGNAAGEAERLELGKLADVRSRAPFCFNFGRGRFRLIEHQGELLAHSTVCTHWLGPLDQCEVEKAEGSEQEILVCPWHGCTFDLKTGESADTHKFKLDTAPRIELDEQTGEVSAVL